MVFTGALITRPIQRVNVVGIGRSVRLQADVPGRLKPAATVASDSRGAAALCQNIV